MDLFSKLNRLLDEKSFGHLLTNIYRPRCWKAARGLSWELLKGFVQPGLERTSLGRRLLCSGGGDVRRAARDFRAFDANPRLPDADFLRAHSMSVVLEGPSFKVPTAGGFIEKEELALNKKMFEDMEDDYSTQRFRWLLHVVQMNAGSEIYDWAYDRIIEWANLFKAPEKLYVFDAYNLSERLVSWTYFLAHYKKFREIRQEDVRLIRSSMQMQLEHLARNLEYHGGKTNNHILNNARCLYICGRVFNLPSAAELGKRVFYSRIDEIVTGGVVNAGSSHYQMLITDWIMQMCLAAAMSGDESFQRNLEGLTADCLKVCALLQSAFPSTEYPLFGDISPDVRPDWHRGPPFARVKGPASKWEDLFIHKFEKPEIRACEFAPPYFYMGSGPVEIWGVVKERIFDHGHSDNGHVVMFLKGRPFIVDGGRSRYTKSERHLSQMDAGYHNMPLVDGRPPEISRRYGEVPQGVSKGRMLQFNNFFCGYRVDTFHGVPLERRISLGEGRVEIEDRPLDWKMSGYSCSWLFAERPEVASEEEGSFSVKFADGTEAAFSGVRARGEIVETFRSLHYGDETKAWMVRIECKASCEEPVRTVVKTA